MLVSLKNIIHMNDNLSVINHTSETFVASLFEISSAALKKCFHSLTCCFFPRINCTYIAFITSSHSQTAQKDFSNSSI